MGFKKNMSVNISTLNSYMDLPSTLYTLKYGESANTNADAHTTNNFTLLLTGF